MEPIYMTTELEDSIPPGTTPWTIKVHSKLLELTIFILQLYRVFLDNYLSNLRL